MAAITFRSNGHDHVVDVVIGPDGYFYTAEWDGERWNTSAYAPPEHTSLSGISPGVAWERGADGRDVLYAFVPSFDQSGKSSMHLHVREHGNWRWSKIHTLSSGRQYDTDCETVVVHRDGNATIYGAAADNRGRLLVPIVSHALRKIVDAGTPDTTNGPAFVRPKLLRVSDPGNERLYAFVSSVAPTGGTGTLLVATSPGMEPWQWHHLGRPHGTTVVSAPRAIDFRRGTRHTIEAYVITADGHLRSCANSGSGWHWFDRGKPPVALYRFAAPAPVSFVDPVTGALRVYVFAFGEDRKLYACHLEGDHFEWAALGAPPHGDLDNDITIGAATALRGNTRYVHAFVRVHLGPNNPRMYQCQWDGHTWMWRDLGCRLSAAMDPAFSKPFPRVPAVA
jgi:hypothetical protein